MTREELIYSANMWVDKAKKDVREKILSYMDENGKNAEEVAYDFGVAEDAIVRITKGDGEFTLDTLAKLLIKSGLVLNVVPVEESPIADEFDSPMDDLEEDVTDDYLVEREEDYDEDDDDCDEDEEYRKYLSERASEQPRDDLGRFKTNENDEEEDTNVPIHFSSKDDNVDEKFPIDERVLELKKKIRSVIEGNPGLTKFFKSIL